MKFGINAQVIIALLGALYILMVCREKYRVEYAEGESVAVEKVEKNGKKLTRKERAIADKEAAAHETKGHPKEKFPPRHKGPRPGTSFGYPLGSTKEKFPHKGYPKRARPAVMPKPGSVEFILSKAQRADQPRTSVWTEFDKMELNIRRGGELPNIGVIPAPDMVAVKAKKTSVAKAPIVAIKAEKNSIIEEEEEAAIEEEATIEEEGMSTGAIAGITAVSIVALIVIMIMMRRLRR